MSTSTRINQRRAVSAAATTVVRHTRSRIVYVLRWHFVVTTAQRYTNTVQGAVRYSTHNMIGMCYEKVSFHRSTLKATNNENEVANDDSTYEIAARKPCRLCA